ncbi:MAG: DDE-type integrase/transposase/recombinase [Verrucomicrobia bacterium]|nr:DDE-type integrase/transposase/recombinase [Verrucomicrobiota bacterium]
MVRFSTESCVCFSALVLRQPQAGLYFHSDRGSQYSSQAVRKPLSVIGAEQSMSAAGNCYENATMEAFFSTLKTECFPDNQLFSTRVQARREIFQYIELYYNTNAYTARLDTRARETIKQSLKE